MSDINYTTLKVKKEIKDKIKKYAQENGLKISFVIEKILLDYIYKCSDVCQPEENKEKKEDKEIRNKIKKILKKIN